MREVLATSCSPYEIGETRPMLIKIRRKLIHIPVKCRAKHEAPTQDQEFKIVQVW
jgi:hypothetical protein